jgi:hypothetical protein
MKKIKFMVIIIAILSLVGGALAFKAQKFTSSTVYCFEWDPNHNPYCVFSRYQRVNNLLMPTTTIPCGAGISYYTTNMDNCTTNGVTPAANKTVYYTTVE